MERLVYFLKGDRGIYTKDKGKMCFPSRNNFRNAREGFAFVNTCKENEKYNLLNGHMAIGTPIHIEDCASRLLKAGGSEWFIATVGDCEVAYCYDGDFLKVYLNGQIYSDWGYTEEEVYKSLTVKGQPRRVYVRGYALKSQLGSIKEPVSLEDIKSVVCWNFGRKDKLYSFCDGKVVMFDPSVGYDCNKGVLIGKSWVLLSLFETVEMWEFLRSQYSGDIGEIKF